MRYASINPNDFVNGEGTCVSLWTQGCPFHCPGCFNPETWDFTKGREFNHTTIDAIIKLIEANGIQRNLSLLGGEPLYEDNIPTLNMLISILKKKFPNIKIFIWSGYYLNELINRQDPQLIQLLQNSDFLIAGPFIQEQRDLTLKWRGSKNQQIINLKEVDFN